MDIFLASLYFNEAIEKWQVKNPQAFYGPYLIDAHRYHRYARYIRIHRVRLSLGIEEDV